MSVESWIVDVLHGLSCARRSLFRAGAVLPFVAFAAVQIGMILLLAEFTAPGIHWISVPLVRVLGGEHALHYPMHLVALPGMYEPLYLALLAVVGIPLYAAGVRQAAVTFQGRDTRSSLRPSWIALVTVGVVYVVAAVAGPTLSAVLAGHTGEGAASAGIRAMGVVLGIVGQALFVYSPVAIALSAQSATGALRQSLRWFSTYPGPTLILLAVVALINLPGTLLLEHADRIVLKFSPELVIYIMLAGVVVEAISAFVLFTSIAGLAVGRKQVGW